MQPMILGRVPEGGRIPLSASSKSIGFFAVLTLVALRLCIGWHFYKEGVDHYQDRHFTSAHMLQGAVGPWADYYRGLAGADFHRWDALLAQPLRVDPQAAPPAEAKEGEIPEGAPYKDWAEQVLQDWRSRLHAYLDHFSLSKPQQDAGAAVFEKRKQQLLDYLEEESGAIAEYRHELFRLDHWKKDVTAEGVPFQQERIEKKTKETAGTAAKWKKDVQSFEQAYAAELSAVLGLDAAQQDQARDLLQEDRLTRVDKIVTYLILGVGVCLILGLFTRLAAVAGAGFLLSVITTQPPWTPGATPVYYQTVEMIALLVLAAMGAGRWGGLDYFTSCLFRRNCAAKGSQS